MTGSALEEVAHTVASAATKALLVEALAAPKPGLVDRYRDLKELNVFRMAVSAVSAYRWFARAAIGGARGSRGVVGRCVLGAVRDSISSQRGGNAHLGALLLLVPLCAAAGRLISSGSRSGEKGLRREVVKVMRSAGEADAVDVFAAIREAKPGGLGKVAYLDVTDPETYHEIRKRRIRLLEALSVYRGRDLVADELVEGYPLTFEVCLPVMRRYLGSTNRLDVAVVNGLLAVMAARPDTHVVRRNGLHVARYVSDLAKGALRLGGIATPAGRRAVERMDSYMRSRDVRPGSSADVVDAALMALLLLHRVKP
ncbi:MAG: triphosphoribosyl-dephospho-CoA synthase [Nitrososphaerota archaeon]|nr:triphosphoribosyl-dephospho-CoA synthase [Candidatus Calditenuis fumarioli]